MKRVIAFFSLCFVVLAATMVHANTHLESPVEVNLRLLPSDNDRFNGLIEIVNLSDHNINGWTLSFVTAVDIQGFLQAVPDAVDKELGAYSIRDDQHNAFIMPGESVLIGLRGKGYGAELSECRFNGKACFGQGVKAEESFATRTGISHVFGQRPTPSTLPLNVIRDLVSDDDNSGPRMVGYYAGWSIYDKNYHVQNIPADKLTHVNYAFIQVNKDYECVLGDAYADIKLFYPDDDLENAEYYGNFNQLRKLKEQHPHLKVLMSVGGWLWSDYFSDAALNDKNRETLIDSCIKLLQDYDFDGIDYVWQYPVESDRPEVTVREEDKTNYTKLVELTRKKLDIAALDDGKNYLLTMATSAQPERYLKHLELGKLHPHVDWFNVSSYDFHGSWEPMTNHHAPLYANPLDPAQDPVVKRMYNINSAVNNYIFAGVPAEKIVLGIGLYGRAWSGMQSINNLGLYSRTDGSVPAGSGLPGVFDYQVIFNEYLTNQAYQRVWDDFSKVPFLVNQSNGTFISYDDPESVAIKSHYVLHNNLGGIALWELSGDVAITPKAKKNVEVEDYYQLITTAHSILFPQVAEAPKKTKGRGFRGLMEKGQDAKGFSDQQGFLGGSESK